MKTFMTQNPQEKPLLTAAEISESYVQIPVDQQKLPFTEADFLEYYGEHPIDNEELNKLPFVLTISAAIAMEAKFCPASKEIREDSNLRLKKLAEYVGRKALLPGHQYLLDEDLLR